MPECTFHAKGVAIAQEESDAQLLAIRRAEIASSAHCTHCAQANMHISVRTWREGNQWLAQWEVRHLKHRFQA